LQRVSAQPVLFIAGKHPIREIGGFGHSVYVRAHARAATLAGYEPHIFCFGECDALEREPFGIVHQIASRQPPRQLAIGRLGPLLADAILAFVGERPRDEPVLIHGFGVWAYAGVLARRRLPDRRVALVASSYATHLDESVAMLAGARLRDGAARYASLVAQALWSASAVEPRERRGYRDADIVAVNYEAIRVAIGRRHGCTSNVRIARYSSDEAFANPVEAASQRVPNEPPRIVSASGHFQRKGIDVLLRAYAILRDRGVAFAADIVGGGALIDAHRALASQHGLDGHVTIHGRVPAVGPFLANGDVFVLPSRSEQSGALALIEALEYGLPTVASNCDGIPEDLAGSEAGMLVRPGDPVELADALAHLLADPAERGRRAIAARERFVERFSPQAFAADIGRIYQDAIAMR
jgi:glycosyltransferase involved in cell wall biosynthesis